MKKVISTVVVFALISAIFTGCGEVPEDSDSSSDLSENESSSEAVVETAPHKVENAVNIVLSDEKITVDGDELGDTPISGVTLGGEIIYYHNMDAYESGNPYGEGTDADKHTDEEASEHTLVTITKPGTYAVTGKLSKGQIAIDLGEDAVSDPAAKVTLFLNGVDITCDIAPAIIFYNVYECSDSTLDTGGNVDTSSAGANVIIADGTENNVNGSYVAKIYENNDKAKKLAEYDGAFYSKRSMNVSTDGEGTGVLNIVAKNEGMDSELHLTINGGNINITSQNDGINTNEDGISVTTVNDGNLVINAGLGQEGDGIDSNGYIVINGGTIFATAKSETGDGGIDADKGIFINGGTVAAFGGRNDDVDSASIQNYMQLTFREAIEAGSKVELRNRSGDVVMEYSCDQRFQSLTLSGKELELDKQYSLFVNGIQQGYLVGAGVQGGTGEMPRDENTRENAFSVPEGFDEWINSTDDIPDEIREWLKNIAEKAKDFTENKNDNKPLGEPDRDKVPTGSQQEMPQNSGEQNEQEKGAGIGSITLNEFSTKFVITEENKSFYGIESAE